MNLICYYKGHNFKHVSNFEDLDIRRGLWQCTRCKVIRMDMPSEFYDGKFFKQPYGK